MKGRRRARRAALQALYELDLSDHPVEAVLAARDADMCRTALSGRLTPDDLASVVAAIEQRGLDEESTAEAVASTSLEGAEASDAVRLMTDLMPQVSYARAVVRGVLANRAALDKAIAAIAPEWPVDQMAPVDRNIMRMAIWELGSESAPVRVAINEAVELARQFSGEGARRLVNGALGNFAAKGTSVTLVNAEE